MSRQVEDHPAGISIHTDRLMLDMPTDRLRESISGGVGGSAVFNGINSVSS